MKKIFFPLLLIAAFVLSCSKAKTDLDSKPELSEIEVPKFHSFSISNQGIELDYTSYMLDSMDSYVFTCGLFFGSQVRGSQLCIISEKVLKIEDNKLLIKYENVKDILFDCSHMDNDAGVGDSILAMFNINLDTVSHGQRFVLDKQDFDRCFDYLKSDSGFVMNLNILSKDKMFFANSDTMMKYGSHMLWSYRLRQNVSGNIRTPPDTQLFIRVDPENENLRIGSPVSTISYTF